MPKLTYHDRRVIEEQERATVAAKLPMIAAALGGQLDVDPESSRAYAKITGSDWEIRTYHDTYHHRLVVYGHFSHELDRHRRPSGPRADPECKITCSVNRPVGAIARDIQNRIIPQYRELFGILSARNGRHDQLQDAKQNLARRVAAAGRGTIVQNQHATERDTYQTLTVYMGDTRAGSSNPWGKTTISGYAAEPAEPKSLGIRDPKHVTATMELHNVPAELAEYIASLLGEWAEEGQ